MNTENKFIYNEKTHSKIYIDFDRVCTKYLKIKCNSSDDAAIIVTYGPTEDFLKLNFELNLKKGKNEILTSHYIACRYLQFDLKSKRNVICEIEELEFIDSQYQMKSKAFFECDDSKLNDIWKMGAYTVELCLQKNDESCAQKRFQLSKRAIRFLNKWKKNEDNFVVFDAPRRDREAWLGDFRAEALVIYSAFGDYGSVKNTFDIFFDLQKRKGWTYASGATWQRFLEYNLWFIVAFWEYYLYSGDKDYIIKRYQNIKALIKYLLKNLNDKCFIHSDACWMWTFPREGYSSAMQSILYKALSDGKKIADSVDDKEFSEKLDKICNHLKININNDFWDSDKGVYIDNIGFTETKTPVFADVNCYAILFGIADDEKIAQILKYLKENMWTEYGSATIDTKIQKAKLKPNLKSYAFTSLLRGSKNLDEDLINALYPHNKQVWPFMNGYELQARFMADDNINAMQLIENCWGNPKYRETGTFWELFDVYNNEFSIRPFSLYDTSDSYNSECHGWSGLVTTMMQEYILGVRPLEPGFKKVVIEPHLYNLKSVKGIVPTPSGDISVDINFTDNKWVIVINHPADLEVDVSTKSSCFATSQVDIKINE